MYTSVADETGTIPPSMHGVDKPNSASAQTYKVQFYDTASTGLFAKYTADSVTATIVAEEIMT
jgi:hypothetical protein